MSDPPIERLRHWLDAAYTSAIEGLGIVDSVEADAARGAAMRECEDRGLDFGYCTEGDAGPLYRVWHWKSDTEIGEWTTLREALDDWNLRNEVTD